MALVFESDPTQIGFNAYCAVTYADDFQASKLNTNWAALPDATKEALIIWASREIDTIDWKGVKTSSNQDKEFPRTYLYKHGVDSDIMLDATTIPTFIQNFAAELAGVLSEDDVTLSSSMGTIKRIKVDSIEVEGNEKSIESKYSWIPNYSFNSCKNYMSKVNQYQVNTIRVGYGL